MKEYEIVIKKYAKTGLINAYITFKDDQQETYHESGTDLDELLVWASLLISRKKLEKINEQK